MGLHECVEIRLAYPCIAQVCGSLWRQSEESDPPCEQHAGPDYPDYQVGEIPNDGSVLLTPSQQPEMGTCLLGCSGSHHGRNGGESNHMFGAPKMTDILPSLLYDISELMC